MPSIHTPKATLMWPFLFQARLSKDAKPGDKAKYECKLLFTAEDCATPQFKAMQQAVVDAAVAKFGQEKATTMIREKSLRSPFRTDVVTKGYPEHFKCYITLRANADQQPGIVDRYADPKTGKPRVITDPNEIYSGCEVRAAIEVYAYGGAGTAYTPGVSFSIRSLQKLKDGPRLDGRKAAVDEFDAEELPEAAFDTDGASAAVTETTSSGGGSKEDLNDLLG